MKKNIIAKKSDALKIFSGLGEEFAVVNNSEFVFSPVELYPLAKKQKAPIKNISAFVMDMDGTTTTTETLCLYSLDRMIALMSGLTIDSPLIVDKEIDYPHIIGNSTTKHVEYLVNKYQNKFDRTKIASAFLFAAVWTLKFGKDVLRKKEVEQNLKNFGCEDFLSPKLLSNIKIVVEAKQFDSALGRKLEKQYSLSFSNLSRNDFVKLGIDIYYQKYHQLLHFVIEKNRKELSVVVDEKHEHLIEPMPGVEVFLPLVKGMIDDNYEKYFSFLLQSYRKKTGKKFPENKIHAAKKNFVKLCKHFKNNPVKIAIVTSSIFYEANIVLTELFEVIRQNYKQFLSAKERSKLLNNFAEYQKYYNAVITASDSSEIRLKPHRDLYSIALAQLNISKKDFVNVIGFEDSESGTIAIRAAGIGFSISVPFNETSGHRFDAASHVLHGGLPEFILLNNCFIKI